MNCIKCKRSIVQGQTYYFKNGKPMHLGECPKLAVRHYAIEKFVPTWVAFDKWLTEKQAKAKLKVRRKQHPKDQFRIANF